MVGADGDHISEWSKSTSFKPARVQWFGLQQRSHTLPSGGINDPDFGLIRLNKASSWQVNICHRWIYLLYNSAAALS